MPLGLIFDVDGTLVTFRFDVQGTRKALFTEISKLGFSTANLTPNSSTQKVMDEVKAQVAAGIVKYDLAFVRRKLYDVLDEFEMVTSREAELLPGTMETLRGLRERSVRLCVLTNAGKRSAVPLLLRHSLLSFFDFVLTRDDVGAMKPDPDGVHKAVSLLSLPKDEIRYVGDSLLDITAAKKAGLGVISVATGNYDKERLRAEGADVVIEALPRLFDVLPL